MIKKICKKDFLKFRFFGLRRARKSGKIGFLAKKARRGPKNQNFKNSYTAFLDNPLRMPHANF